MKLNKINSLQAVFFKSCIYFANVLFCCNPFFACFISVIILYTSCAKCIVRKVYQALKEKQVVAEQCQAQFKLGLAKQALCS